MQTVVGELSWLVLNKRIVNKDKSRLMLLELSLEPVELLFPKRADVRMEVRRGVVLRAAEKVIKMNEFVTLIVQNGVRLRIELGFEETVAHLARNSFEIVVMVAKAQMHRHLEAIGDDLGVVETRRVLEVKVIVDRRVVMEVVANEEHLLNGRMKRIDKIARRDETRSGEQDA